jgi:hypothetical protein
MARPPLSSWTPTQFEELVEPPFHTSMGTAKVRTNATTGYLKALGNCEGPHHLACELVGTLLADRFGLTVPACAFLDLEEIDCYDLPKGARTRPGPAFISRDVPGRTWGRSRDDLKRLENPEDITRMVVFDNWVRNRDRHPPASMEWKPNPANVYLADTERPERYRLYAIDHSQCFDWGRALTTHLSDIDKIRDDGVYGLFPEFTPFVDLGVLVVYCISIVG